MNRKILVLSLAAILAGAFTAFAQTPAPGGTGTPLQGFSIPLLVGELSLYLPPESTQGGQGAQRGPLQFTRDPKLYLTKDQISKLLPIMQGLRENPMPSPNRAKQASSEVDSVLTSEQKAEREQFRNQIKKLRQGFQAQGGQRLPDFQNMTEQQRQDFLNSLPEDQRQRIQQRMQQAGGGQQLTPLQRRQRMLDNFIKILQDRQKQLGG